MSSLALTEAAFAFHFEKIVTFKFRFKNPVPAKSWNEVYLADKHGVICPQSRDGMYGGEEDCLYLSVYSPVTEFNSSKVK